MMTRKIAVVLMALSCAWMVSCSSSSSDPSGPDDSTPPTIASVSLLDGETDVGLIERIAVEFSEAMDPATIDERSIYAAGRAALGHVEYDAASHTAYFTPDTLYAAETPHVFVVADSVCDEAGNLLGEPDTTAFETGPLDCAHLHDCFEPNQSIAEATPAELDRLYRTLAVCGADADVYEINLEERTKIEARAHIKAVPDTGAAEWWIQFLRSDGESYGWTWSGTAPGYDRTFRHTFEPGTYYVLMEAPDEPFYVLYDAEFETQEPCGDDAYEDNDFLDEAAPVLPGLLDLRGCYLDSDVFVVDVAAGQTITATYITHEVEGTPARNFNILKPTGSNLTYSSAREDSVTISGLADQTGGYYVLAKYWADDVGYTLRIEITE